MRELTLKEINIINSVNKPQKKPNIFLTLFRAFLGVSSFIMALCLFGWLLEIALPLLMLWVVCIIPLAIIGLGSLADILLEWPLYLLCNGWRLLQMSSDYTKKHFKNLF